MVCVPDVDEECLDQGGDNGVEVGRDEFSGAGGCGDDGSAGVAGLVDFGEQIEPGSVGLGDYKAGGGGGEITEGDEVMDDVGDGGLMGHARVMVKGE
eukprot:g32091.t1